MNSLNLIYLVAIDDHELHINIDKIIFIEDVGEARRIYSNGATILVKEDVETILQKIRSVAMLSIC